MINKLFKDMEMDDVHQKILNSVKYSDEFKEEKLHNMFVSILLDMFIHKNDGLKFFADYYVVTKEDFYLFFKQPIIEYFDEDTYSELESKIGEE